MSSRNPFASSLMACLLALGPVGIAPANATLTGPGLLNSGQDAKRNVAEIKNRGPGPRLYPPIVPSYLYYNYPYYYSRGYYPTHIGPGFIYYGHPYYKSSYYLRYGSRRTRSN
jgi:hypothetical protein